MDDTVSLSTYYDTSVVDSLIQTIVPAVDITDGPSIPTKTTPSVLDEWVTVAQQTIHLKFMGMAPRIKVSILLYACMYVCRKATGTVSLESIQIIKSINLQKITRYR